MTDMESKAEVENLMKDWPDLTFVGFHTRQFKESLSESGARRVEDRARMLTDDALGQFQHCRRYIAANLEVGPRVNRESSSYGLKHRAEKVYEGKGYVSNGMFIAAMIAAGFRICATDGPNAYFNITPASMKRTANG